MKLRIAPIDRPKGLLKKIMFFILKKEFGKVIMPARVIYSRYPKIGMLVKKVYDVEDSLKLVNATEKIFIQNLVATLNGCSFCMDISKRRSMDKAIGPEKFNNLMNYDSSNHYTDREKAVFAYVTEMTRDITVSDAVYDALKKYCSDEEIIEITYVSASENYLNRLIKPLNIGSDELCSLK